MRVAIFSDTHLGFDEHGERASESFDNLGQAIALCVRENADFAVFCGDLFDAPVPSHSSLYRAMCEFSKAKQGTSEAKVFVEKDGMKRQASFSGLPILAIHGNHEYAGKDSKSALDVLAVSEALIYFHAAKAIVEKPTASGFERAVVHGLGAVPEKKALQALQAWGPVPEKGASNMLLLHQGFKEFMAIDDEMVATLSLDDLPAGFDLVVNGHLHWSSVQELRNQVFLLPGSTIATSIKRLESQKPKGVHFYDTVSKKLDFLPLPLQRKMFYHGVMLSGSDTVQVIEKCRALLEESLKAAYGSGTHGAAQMSSEMKPLIRINLKGSLKKGLSPSDVGLHEILQEFSAKAILSISKNFSGVDFKRKIADLRELQKSKQSVAALGFEMLEKNLSETDFGLEVSARELFDMLSSDELDKAFSAMTKK